jgi:UDP-N-acetylmuramate--alanine ligase
MPIYPARELPIEGINSELIMSKIKNINVSVLTHSEVIEKLKFEKKGVFITIGAGDIDKLIQPLKTQFLG